MHSARLGAGNPKGTKIFEDQLTSDTPEPWIVVDQYRVPLGKRPVVSPSITTVDKAQAQFKDAVFSIGGKKQQPTSELNRGSFHRCVGDGAIIKLTEYLEKFESEVLTNVDDQPDN